MSEPNQGSEDCVAIEDFWYHDPNTKTKTLTPRKHRWVTSWTGKTKQCMQCLKFVRLEAK